MEVSDLVPMPNYCTIPMLPTTEPPNKALLPPFPHCPGPQITCTTQPVSRPSTSQEFAEKFPEEALIYDAVKEKKGPQLPWCTNSAQPQAKYPRMETTVSSNTRTTNLQTFWNLVFRPGSLQPTFLPWIWTTTLLPLRIPHTFQVTWTLSCRTGPSWALSKSHLSGTGFRTNPMLTRPRRDSEKLRVILDLSFPIGHSVNAGIPSCQLDGSDFKLRLPTIHHLAANVVALGRGCHMYKVDLSRAYRQLRSDPWDWPLLRIAWVTDTFLDVAIPFGLRHGASVVPACY